MEIQEIKTRLDGMFSSFSTKPILFVGSGLSRRYLDLPDWATLLKVFANKVDPLNPMAFNRYHQLAKLDVESKGLSINDINPIIGKLISQDYKMQFYSDITFEKELKDKYPETSRNEVNPFKIAIAEFIKSYELKTATYTSEEKALINLKNRISNIVTTNYDNFLEDAFTGFEPYVGQEDILNKRLSTVGNIFKIHGSMSQPSSIVIDYDDYKNFNDKHKFLSAKLLTFFLENPIIFLGYGINDPDIKLIFDDIKCCLNNENEELLSRKLLFIEFTEDETKQDIIVSSEIAGVRMTKIILKDYNIIYNSFNKITEALDVGYLRTIESKIVQLIQTSNKRVKRVHSTSLENTNLDPKDIAIYLGDKSSVLGMGYKAITIYDLCEDVLFHTENFDAAGIIEETIPQQRARFGSSKLPLYKYLAVYDQPLDDYMKNKIITSLDELYIKSAKISTLYNKENVTFSEVLIPWNFSKTLTNVHLAFSKLNIEEIKSYLKSNWLDIIKLSSYTYLLKIVCAIDFIENKKNPN